MERDTGIADLIYEQAKKLPEHLAREVLDFVGYLAEREEREHDCDLQNAQESALKSSGTIRKTKLGTVLERGNLVLIPSPFADLFVSKKRPSWW